MFLQKLNFYLYGDSYVSNRQIIKFINSQPDDRLIDFSGNYIHKNSENKCGTIAVHICRDIFKEYFMTYNYSCCFTENGLITFDVVMDYLDWYFYNKIITYKEVKNQLKKWNFDQKLL